MTLRDSLLARTAKQLGHPNGRTGQLVGRLLNRGNRTLVLAAIDAIQVQPGQVVADIGFGGGVALGPLLDRVNTPASSTASKSPTRCCATPAGACTAIWTGVDCNYIKRPWNGYPCQTPRSTP